MIATDPALLAADPAEISDTLLEAGLTGIHTWRDPDGLHIIAEQGDDAIAAALVGFVPTTTGPDSWRGALPPAVRTHLAHMLDYRGAVRSGAQAAKTAAVRQAEAEHVIADVIDALRLLRSEFE